MLIGYAKSLSSSALEQSISHNVFSGKLVSQTIPWEKKSYLVK